MIGTIFKAGIAVILILAVWKLAGGTPEGIANLFETIFGRVGDFLNAISTKVADFFGAFLGGGGAETTSK
jgi:phage-related protein